MTGLGKLWPTKKEWVMLIIFWGMLTTSIVYEADVPFTKETHKIVDGNSTEVYITFSDNYPRCIFQRDYSLDVTPGCGELSLPGQNMFVEVENSAENCKITPTVKCNFGKFKGKPVCWNVNTKSLTGCALKKPKSTFARDAFRPQTTSEPITEENGNLPTSSIPFLAGLLYVLQKVLMVIGGPSIKEAVDGIAIQAFPLTLAFDMILFACVVRIGTSVKSPIKSIPLAKASGSRLLFLLSRGGGKGKTSSIFCFENQIADRTADAR